MKRVLLIFAFLVTSVSFLFAQEGGGKVTPSCPQQSCGTENRITLSDRVVAPGSTIQLALKVSTLHSIYGMDFEVQFPRDSVYPRGFWLSNWPFCNSYPVWADYWNDSLYHFALASGDSFCTDRIFGYLRMHVEKNIDSGTVLQLPLHGFFSDTTSSFEVPTINGSIMVGPSVIFGDWTNDSSVDLPDVVGILRYAVHGGTLTMRQLLAGDVTGDGFVNSYDGWFDIYKVVNPYACFPVEDCGYYFGGKGSAQPVGVTLAERNGNTELSFSSSDSVTNGDLNLTVPAGAQVELAPGANAFSEFSRNGNDVKVAFIGNGNPIVGKPVLLIRNASPQEISVSGKVNEGIPIVTNVGTPTGVKDPREVPKEFSLGQNYPNPFNPATEISYSLDKHSFVTLKVYNMLGEEVATLVNGEKEPGKYSASFDGQKLSSGVYFYRLTAGDITSMKKMLLAK
ncbi:MAG: T9SS type A sorting domain-containing protein [Patescibacteria group bacterium]